ncbi:MAG: GNAT family N-acetyltransferase [Marivirga sp.]|nr:GNAT family N-acetyltransferase [Marivirga sp.]
MASNIHPKLTIDDISIRTELRSGDLGYVIYRHGKLYHEEHGFGLSFEAYVASGIYEFYSGYDPSKDRVWVCEHQSDIIGFMALMHREKNTAQLRYFYIEPAYRGIGLGKKLMSLYMEFLLQCGYTSAYLLTTHELQAAASLYTRYGFKLVGEKKSTSFDKPLKEQRYELTVP